MTPNDQRLTLTNHQVAPQFALNKMLNNGWRLIVTIDEAYLIKDGVVGKFVVNYTVACLVANYQIATEKAAWKVVTA
jgi:hypothetical protein